MVLNLGKCHYMTFGLNTTKNEFVFEDGTIVPSAEEHVVLGIAINFRLTFYSHLKQLFKKVANKLNALTRIALFHWAIKLLSINMDILLQTFKSSYEQTPRTSS